MSIVARLFLALLVVTITLGCGARGREVDGAPDASPGVATSPPQATATTRTGFARDERGALVAFHLGHRFTTTVDATGATFASLDEPWRVSLHVARIGREGAMRALEGARPEEREARVEIARTFATAQAHGDGAVVEWFAQTERGVEHGVDLATRPSGEGALLLELATEGLTPEVAGEGAVLRDQAGRAVLHYDELAVQDAAGRALAARMELRAGRIALRVEDEGARYPLVIDPIVSAKQRAKLVAPDGVSGDSFGYSVALSGNTALVGAYGKQVGAKITQGVAYVFVQSGATWSQQAKLVASDGAGDDNFGSSVALSGGTALVGAPQKTVGSNSSQGVVYVFVQSGTTWSQQAKLVATDGAATDRFGSSVALSGNTALIGAAGRGAAYVFVQSGATWSEQAKLVAPPDGIPEHGFFGEDVALSGGTALVGAYAKRVGLNWDQGAAYVFVQSGTTWSHQAKLVAADGRANDNFGRRVALSDDTALIGAASHKVGTKDGQGAAYVFVRSGATWSQQAQLAASDGASADGFGTVALSGNTALIGASNKNSRTGAAYLFERSGTSWSQKAKLVASDGASSDYLGGDVALSGNTALVGAYGKNTNQGAAYVFVGESSNGAACTAGWDCASGFCVDGVCCSTACSGACQACSAAKKASGTDGTCGAIKEGTDPDGECSPYFCGASGCKTSCAADTDCAAAGYFCDVSACVPKRTNGAACLSASQCASGHCVDGVCCDTACTGLCQACAAASKVGGVDGVCGPAKDGVDPHGDCAAPSCVGATLTERVCNGSSGCRDKTSSCAPFACAADGKGCATTCTSDADCGATQFCDPTHVCAAKKKRGEECGGNSACQSGFCADGYCCDNACTGSCQACGEPGKEGTCSAVTGLPRTGHTACPQQGTTCGGYCDGSKAFDCSFPGAATTCGSGCKDGAIAHCDGAGACGAPSACPGSFACADATSCKSSCVANSDCAGGYACTAGACTPTSATCSDDGSTSTSAGGKVQPCAPYRCNTSSGTCYEGCTTSDQCGSSSTCEVASKTCVPDAPTTAESGGCSLTTRPTSTGGIALAAMAVLAAVVRRRPSLPRRR